MCSSKEAQERKESSEKKKKGIRKTNKQKKKVGGRAKSWPDPFSHHGINILLGYIRNIPRKRSNCLWKKFNVQRRV